MDPILSMHDVTYYYEHQGNPIPIISNVSYGFQKSMLYTLLGPSGSGKTTTLALLGALERPREGKILYDGRDIRELGETAYRNRHVSIVFQAYNLLEYLTPLQNVLAAMDITQNPIANKKERAKAILAEMNLNEALYKRKVSQLSGGEQQRVAIMAVDTDILLADEPTGNLDPGTAGEIIELIYSVAHEKGKCVIVATHSEKFAERADKIIHIENKSLLCGE